MKFVKRFLIFLVLCLAVFGGFTLFKKAPELNITVEDVKYLEEIGKSASTEASREGLSGVLMNVEGAPPIDATGLAEGTATPPPTFGIGAASFGNATDEAPAFAVNEAPAFAPAFDPPAPVMAKPTVPVASPFQQPAKTTEVIAEPIEAPEPPPLLPTTALEPVEPTQTTELTKSSAPPQMAHLAQHPNPVATPPTPAPSPLLEIPLPVPEPPLPDPPLVTWDGPVTEVADIPSSIPQGSQEDFRVSGPTESQADLARNENPQVNHTPVKRLPVVPDSIQEDTAIIPLFAVTTLLPVSETTQAPIASTKEQYRQTSVRHDLTFSSPPVVDSGVVPVISFAQPNSTETESPSVPDPFAMNEANAAASAADDDAFAAMETSGDNTATFVSPNKEADLSAMLRPAVTRYVKAQAVLTESGEPEKLRAAFIQLSKMYESPDLNNAERRHMRPWLDRLALSVIYSKHSHILEPAYRVQSNDTIESVAATINLSPALLRKINGLSATQALVPGTELKIVLGRFDAKISTSRNEMTLILGGLYAGSFPVGLGKQFDAVRGEFFVYAKTNETLLLNNGIELRSANTLADTAPPTVRFAEKDASEIFDILTEQSVIVFED